MGIECRGEYILNRVLVEEEKQRLQTQDVYICKISAQQTSRILQFIALQGTEWESAEISVQKVPSFPPYTKEQFDEWKQLWPVAYRPLVQLKPVQLDDDERAYINENLSVVSQLQAKSDSEGNRGSAVIVGSPKAREAIVQSTDMTHTLVHPLKHAVMCCISKIADIELDKKKQGCFGDQCTNDNTNDQSEVQLVPAKRAHTPDIAGTPLVTEQISSANDIEDNAMEFTSGYLCGGLDVFSSKEPCVMCCMALVHSRIGRLFFIDPSESGGISYYSINSRKALNHNFTAFQCTLTSTQNLTP
ncbi:tRNA-specific adenosine deaminase subunit tad3 [Coemansia spiralis]|uniref:tRNA-specific adenosine deaminase subunit tad3 n=2 Tax=Coemansia TaxID=4863 RepID=A0A9W8KXK7_9FUNG|nr:tRNA-specific adenosine deaminase subunit tad3 [Coemansia umbellata]KAJ2621234.1 tRNA-specific adenosine deaminase subunit tad3 [Coemansia sp. RSA 1358]KAJ2676781.1 tRNA-specific adenosine deaminase subunit tad3 [Coemansia spiralis]